MQVQPDHLRRLIAEELDYLVGKYPSKFRLPADISRSVDPTLLSSVDKTRVLNPDR